MKFKTVICWVCIISYNTLCPMSGYSAEKVLVWGDEFNYTGPPDSTKWGYETGFIRNEEAQYYTSTASNVRVENGTLILEAHKKDTENELYDPLSDNWRHTRKYTRYTSGSVLTRGLMDFKHGRLEIQAKLPQGDGVWPAAWTTGSNIPAVGWPACGEIDIMEYVGKEPETVFFGLHYQSGSSRGSYKTINPQEYHLYAIEWGPDQIKFYVDEALVKTFNVDEAGVGPENPFRLDHVLRLNLAIGGTWGGVVNDNIFPVRYVIDYVRLYTEKHHEMPGVYYLLMSK